MNYAGDLRPSEAWDLLAQDADAVLIDVRTQAEWAFVGGPDLAAFDKRPLLVSWQVFPTMGVNPDFAERVAEAVPSKDTPLLFLCRSGGRSRAAAMAMAAEGYGRCFNISEGFEGSLDADRHRGRVGGWKAAGLPWVQD